MDKASSYCGMSKADWPLPQYVQIPPFYAVLDRINSFLEPDTGIFGVVDFYVSGKTPPGKQSAMIGGDVRRECGPISRWFWRQWFSLDHVELHPARRGE